MIQTPADFRGMRLFMGLTPGEAGELCGVTDDTIRGMERGKVRLFPDAVAAMTAYSAQFERGVDAIMARGGDCIAVYRDKEAFAHFETEWAPVIRFPSAWAAAATVARFELEPMPALVDLRPPVYDRWRGATPDSPDARADYMREELARLKALVW